MFLIDTHPDFTKFCYLIKLAELDNILDDIQADFTLFVPSDTELKYINDVSINEIDKCEARHIILSSMLNNRVPSELLSDSPAAYFITRDPPNRLFLTNINGEIKINRNINILLNNIICKNGIVHVIDRLIKPLQL